MTLSIPSERARELAAHPQVLHAAWQRMVQWYASGEIAPEPEFSQWQMNPEAKLKELGRCIVEGSYAPSPFPLVPYPKKGAALRHYCRPSVRDQVAFLAYTMLLAPWLEAEMPSFSFANRWYRGIHQGVRNGNPVWLHRSYLLEDVPIYQPYRRAHGLFRRVAHWSASAMVGAEREDDLSARGAVYPESYPSGMLPAFCRREWWAAADGAGPNQGYWAELDLQLAYPSVRVDLLGQRMETLLRNADELEDDKTPDYPCDVLTGLKERENRCALANELCRLLQEVRYDTKSAPDDLWVPPHATHTLPTGDGSGHPGLPTGLAVSGLFLNVYLHPVDRAIGKWCESTGSDGRKSAGFLRFADDMILLATDKGTLFKGIDRLWQALCNDDEKARLANPGCDGGANLRLSLSKLGPAPIAKIVARYLEEHGWKECSGCKQYLPYADGHKAKAAERLSEWWCRKDEKDNKDCNEEAELRRAALTSDNLGQFVTHLVERLSDLGTESLLERFGEPARRHVVALQELAQLEIDDRQVRVDTRLSFAANQLARAWLPEDDLEGDRTLLRVMRAAVASGVRRAPWKFKLWRAVVRMAIRRPCFEWLDEAARAKDQKDADGWLCGLLRHIACLGERSADDFTSWYHNWPEEDDGRNECWRFFEEHQRREGEETTQGDPVVGRQWQRRSRRQSLSALRAAFWQSLADGLMVVHHAVQATTQDAEVDAQPSWTSQHWSFRALPEAALSSVWAWLANLDHWAKVLYPEGTADDALLPVERDAIARACLTVIEPGRLIDAWEPVVDDAQEHDYALVLQLGRALGGAQPDGISRLLGLLGLLSKDYHSAELRYPATLKRARRPSQDERNRLLGKIEECDAQQRWHLIRGLGLTREIAEEDILWLEQRAQELLRSIGTDGEGAKRSRFYWALREYAAIRQVLFSCNHPGRACKAADELTLHRLLWGDAWNHEHSGRWRIVPAQAPRLGLPLRVAARLLSDALNVSQEEAAPPLTWKFSRSAAQVAARKWLAKGRRCQLGCADWGSLDEPGAVAGKKPWTVIGGLGSFEVLPHPVLLWPRLVDAVDHTEYRRWCHLLQFMTAVEGSESIADGLFRSGTGAIPFEERWHWRHRVHMPGALWREFEQLSRVVMGRKPKPSRDGAWQKMLGELDTINDQPIRASDFRWQRVDLALERDNPMEMPLGVTPYPLSDQSRLNALSLGDEALHENLRVRIGQINEHPVWSRLVNQYPRLDRAYTQKVMKQIWAVVLADDHGAGVTQATVSNSSDGIAIVLLPEATIPPDERLSLSRLASETQLAVLAGCLWRVLPTVAVPHRGVAVPRRYLVNEAQLSVPLHQKMQDALPVVRNLYIQKPVPAHIEEGLARALTQRDKHMTNWQMLPGSCWYRFLHANWGDFTVAICSDLLDPAPWHGMRGQILHLLSCAYNSDVELYEAMTWVRAYENYTNVALVNHGEAGGSFAWSPRSGHRKEITRLRGSDMFLVADVELPVRDLLEHQRYGGENSVGKHACDWLNQGTGTIRHGYKTPPPGYKRFSVKGSDS